VQFSEILRAFINQAREEIEPNEQWDREYPYELVMLRRLVPANDRHSGQLLTTVLQMKVELDALDRPLYTVLPSVVDMLEDELQGHRSHDIIRCPECATMIPVMNQDVRFCSSLHLPRLRD
jgi:hypothetical protein